METRLKRIEISLLALIILTLFLVLRPYIKFTSQNSIEDEHITESKELPDDLSKEITNKIIYELKTSFNQNDWNKMYNVFGSFARAQITSDEIEQEFKRLRPIMGNIGTYAYSHFVYDGFKEGAEWYDIYYKCRFENGKGSIKLSTRTVDELSEVVGINIHLDEI